ncbi:hypothetical protein H6P81_007932 [Aristolochia fimbriata]|uniref:DUF1279 domain-containing protein n=1 Tax=Aristolochia fimbriata TaxID=158543 RepID=A0AAV7F647_ARIFI|nr:hypothetical protein H6P81_007932 [Aristolochia fimbriata]
MSTALLIRVPCNSLSLVSPKGDGFVSHARPSKFSFGGQSACKLRRFHCTALQDTKEKGSTPSAEEITEKFGLEAGLWKIFSSKEEKQEESKQKSKTDQAKELLAKYGGAYLATSISLSIVSFTLCYLLISAGVDVASLLQKVGITASETGEKVGTFALAYAAHKAASPIRFPPTVALTPLVASWIGGMTGKKQDE